MTASADAAVDGHGHRFDRGMDQPDYAFPPFRLIFLVLPFTLGDPKGDILRTSSAIGFILALPASQASPSVNAWS